ncbi:ferredoxin family protein [Pelosinus sp. IPA-1]|uniref:4Fe-4S dicluster domain-containing protein n=1 Tax=Pelosinus sp. IPA-1 TaxID=3029569 RepID=UPI0024362480|nr:ferredoxin family protein [Pelosinus sp. IPA-1]GMA97635.1 ferredoxin [Pelosinus sp. IPA-1]
MSIKIDLQKCTGCGKCREVCPGSLLYKDIAGKTQIRYLKECWGCTSCVKECSFNAIQYYLGADMGGKGSFLYTKQEGQLLHWIVVLPDGTEKILTTDKSQANAY